VMVGSRLPGPGERSKGGAWQLGVVSRSAAGRTVRVEPGETLRRGDRLRFEVMGPGAGADRRYGVIVSLDSAGAVTPFWPRASEARPLAGTRQLLEEAVALDGALGPEKLFLVACAQPVAVAAVTAAGQAALARAGNRVQAVSSLGLHEAAGPGRNCQETSFWFRKVAP